MKISKLYRRYTQWMAFNPPGGLTGPGWNSFNKEFKTAAPIRYWFHRDFKKLFIYPIKWKYEDITNWVRYRTYDKYHVVTTGEKPGYQCTDHIMLHVNFNLLKNFVEISKAYKSYWSDDVPQTWCEQHMPFYRIFYTFRRPDLGIKYLDWEMTLDDPNLPLQDQSPEQARHAREIYALYKWWVTDRPSRVEVEITCPETNDGDDDIFFSLSKINTPAHKQYIADLEQQSKQEDLWNKEDDEMLVRLMKIRRGLWT